MDTDKIIVEAFINSRGLEATQILESLEDQEVAALFEEVPVDLAAKLLGLMSRYKGARSLQLLKLTFATELVEKMETTSADLLLRQVEKTLRNAILENMPKEASRLLQHKLRHPKDSIGALMDYGVPTFPEDFSTDKVMAKLKDQKSGASPYVYLTGRNGTFVGIVKAVQLVLTWQTNSLSSLVNRNVPCISVDSNVESILNHPGWLDYHALPVVDQSEIFLGEIKLEIIRKVQLKPDQKSTRSVIEAGNALGELYRIGLTGLLRGSV